MGDERLDLLYFKYLILLSIFKFYQRQLGVSISWFLGAVNTYNFYGVNPSDRYLGVPQVAQPYSFPLSGE